MERLVDCKWLTILAFGCCCLLGCIDYNGGFPLTDPIPVVNGMLKADSVLSVNLSWSGHPGANSFTPITNARVEVLKDGQRIGQVDSINTDGTYVFRHVVQSNSSYDLSIVVDSALYLSANAYVPPASAYTVEWIASGTYEREIFEVALPKPVDEVSALYLFCYLKGNNGTYDNYGVYCNSPLCDPFNRFRDDSGPDGFNMIFDEFIRIPADALIIDREIIHIASYRPIEIIILEATEDFDYYYKAAFWQAYYDPNIQLPFTWEAIHLPSNIKGGAGIFAGTSTTLFDVSNDYHSSQD